MKGRYPGWFVMQTKRHHRMGGRQSLSRGVVCTVGHGEIHLELVLCFLQQRFPAPAGMLRLTRYLYSYFYSIILNILILFYYATCWDFHIEVWKKPCTILPSYLPSGTEQDLSVLGHKMDNQDRRGRVHVPLQSESLHHKVSV